MTCVLDCRCVLKDTMPLKTIELGALIGSTIESAASLYVSGKSTYVAGCMIGQRTDHEGRVTGVDFMVGHMATKTVIDPQFPFIAEIQCDLKEIRDNIRDVHGVLELELSPDRLQSMIQKMNDVLTPLVVDETTIMRNPWYHVMSKCHVFLYEYIHFIAFHSNVPNLTTTHEMRKRSCRIREYLRYLTEYFRTLARYEYEHLLERKPIKYLPYKKRYDDQGNSLINDENNYKLSKINVISRSKEPYTLVNDLCIGKYENPKSATQHPAIEIIPGTG